MKVKVIAVGKLKERYLRDAVAEYSKRLGRYVKLEVVEVGDESIPHKFSPAVGMKILKTEGDRVSRHLKGVKYLVVLDRKGVELGSEDFAHRVEQLMLRGSGEVTFVIGGSLGLHPSIIAKANCSLSFSRFTFPHQLMRVILLEQLYRCFTIIRGENYHK